MKVFKLRNILNESVSLEQYKTSLSKDEFDELLKTNCKNFSFNDIPLLRGDRNMTDKYYILNPEFRIVNWDNRRMCSIHLHFLQSDLWDGLPKKVKSVDFTMNSSVGKMYGDVYRVIPFDNAKIVGLNKLLGNFNKIIMKDFGNGFMSTIFDNFNNFNTYYNGHTTDMNELSNNLNVLFKDKEKILKSANIERFSPMKNKYVTGRSNVNIIPLLKMYDILNSRNIDFIQYMKKAFSPEQYDIINYNEMIKGKFSIGYTSNPVLLIRN